MTEDEYIRYIAEFNAACAGDGTGFGAFFDHWYAPDAVFEYIPAAKKNAGRAAAIGFWESVHAIMQETIRPHTAFVASSTTVASEAPIDFVCKQDLEWVGVPHKKGTSFRLQMGGFYHLDPDGRIRYVRVYSVYHPAYQVA
ncbi:MAG: nuclear transport factor 2 family protein [Rhodobacteraceae bacterium]|nr:nuclear transport factor 2 family protein [Paracoccaceae bacterium]